MSAAHDHLDSDAVAAEADPATSSSMGVESGPDDVGPLDETFAQDAPSVESDTGAFDDLDELEANDLDGAEEAPGERVDASEDETEADTNAEVSGGPPDYFAMLGIAPGASPEEARHAYLRLAKLWHPDRYRGAPERLRAQAERRMRQINEAYDAVSAQRDGFSGDASAPHTWGVPVGGVRDVFGAPTAAYGWPGGEEGRAETSNPNGAGELFAALALIVALGLIGGVLSGHAVGVGFSVVALIAIAGLGFVAALFIDGTPVNKWARDAVEPHARGSRLRRQSSGRATATSGDGNRSQRQRGERSTSTARAGAGFDGGKERAGGAEADSAEDEPTRFARLVDEALASVPRQFRPYLDNIAVRIEEEPDAETLRSAHVPQGYTLLGLYQGVSLTKRGAVATGPDIITIYRRPIERRCGGDAERIRQQTRATVLHELAHHFGIDHEEMPEWVK